MENTFTEEQAINITIQHGYDGSEFETDIWKSRGCLKPNRTLEALISKLNTIYNHVEVEGKGKKRIYILVDKKDLVEERQFNYKGKVATTEDDIMKEYIFNSLHTKSDFTQSYKGWASVLKFPNTDKLSIEEMVYRIRDLHSGFPIIYNPKETVSKFIQTVGIRNKDVIEKSFKRLEEEGRIKLTEVYNFKTIDGVYEEVTEFEYQETQGYLNKFLQSKDVTYYSYSQSVSSFYKTKKMKQIINQVNEYLSKEFEIEYFFKSFKVEVLNPEVKQEVTIDEFNQAYVKRLVKLTTDRQDKNNYKNSLYFWKRFYLLNTLTLLKFMDVDGIDEVLAKEKKLKTDKVDAFALDVMIHHFDSDVEREKIRHTFGKVENVDDFEESLPF